MAINGTRTRVFRGVNPVGKAAYARLFVLLLMILHAHQIYLRMLMLFLFAIGSIARRVDRCAFWVVQLAQTAVTVPHARFLVPTNGASVIGEDTYQTYLNAASLIQNLQATQRNSPDQTRLRPS